MNIHLIALTSSIDHEHRIFAGDEKAKESLGSWEHNNNFISFGKCCKQWWRWHRFCHHRMENISIPLLFFVISIKKSSNFQLEYSWIIHPNLHLPIVIFPSFLHHVLMQRELISWQRKGNFCYKSRKKNCIDLISNSKTNKFIICYFCRL